MVLVLHFVEFVSHFKMSLPLRTEHSVGSAAEAGDTRREPKRATARRTADAVTEKRCIFVGLTLVVTTLSVLVLLLVIYIPPPRVTREV